MPDLPIHDGHGFDDVRLQEFSDLPTKIITFTGKRYHYYLSASGVRQAGKKGVAVLDHVLDAVNRTHSMAQVHATIVEFINKRREEDRKGRAEEGKTEEGKTLSDLSQDEVASLADGYSEMIAQMARTSFGELSMDRLLTSISASLWAGLLTFYPEMPLDYVDARLSPAEVEAVQAQIQDDLLAMLESTKRAAKVNGQAREMTGAAESDTGGAEQAEKN